jgi:hypothetical protein
MASKVKPSKKPDSGKVMAASLSAAAAAMGCTASMLKRAKKAGAPGFRSNNSVCISELQPWFEKWSEELEPESKEALECERLVIQIKRLNWAHDVERGQYTPNDELKRQGFAIASATRSELLRIKSDAPSWAGLSAPEIEVKAIALVDSIIKNLHDSLSKINA